MSMFHAIAMSILNEKCTTMSIKHLVINFLAHGMSQISVF